MPKLARVQSCPVDLSEAPVWAGLPVPQLTPPRSRRLVEPRLPRSPEQVDNPAVQTRQGCAGHVKGVFHPDWRAETGEGGGEPTPTGPAARVEGEGKEAKTEGEKAVRTLLRAHG